MINLTKQEKTVIIFFIGAILIGLIIQFGLKRIVKLKPIYNLDKEFIAGSLKKIDINSAGADELVKIPGIGQIYAQRIIEYRRMNGPFKNIEDLVKVNGIGPSKVDRIKEHITFGSENN